jgi:hypothetical protein
MMSILTSASLPLCFLLFLFIYSSPSISISFLHYTLIVILIYQIDIVITSGVCGRVELLERRR